MRRCAATGLLALPLVTSFCFYPALAFSGGHAPQEKAGATPPADNRPVLVELFTSEGCSSCPPADEFIRKLDTLQPVAGAQLVVLSEHVDYWNHDGWKDPNSASFLTERQADYERILGVSTPYTPQIIVDGTNEIRLNDPQQIDKVFQQSVSALKLPVRLTAVSVDQGILRAHVEVDASAERRSAEVYLAVALDHVDSQVLHGENGGRHLSHVAVVRQIEKVGKLAKGKDFAQNVQVRLAPEISPGNLRVISFAQAPGPGKLLGAAVWKPAP
jgi:hypothetical protein